MYEMTFFFLHALQAFSLTVYPRNAVSAAGPLCTHGKDKPGLGAPNSLKKFHMLRTDRRARVGVHSVVAEESCYSMLIRIWFDVVAIKVAKSI